MIAVCSGLSRRNASPDTSWISSTKEAGRLRMGILDGSSPWKDQLIARSPTVASGKARRVVSRSTLSLRKSLASAVIPLITQLPRPCRWCCIAAMGSAAR